MSGKDLSGSLQPSVVDDMDLGALNGIDFDAVSDRVAVMQEGGGEVVEPSNTCESGACMI